MNGSDKPIEAIDVAPFATRQSTEFDEVVRQAEAGADVNHTDPQFSEFTPLHWACRLGHLEVVDVLLRQLGAYGFPLDHAGHTPWHLAMEGKHYDLVRYLVFGFAY